MRLLFSCQRCHRETRTWSSSRMFGAHYFLNQKSVFLYFYDVMSSYVQRLLYPNVARCKQYRLVNWSGVICQLYILGVGVREVAHDMQHQVSRLCRQITMYGELAFDTWHGKLIYDVLVRGDHFQVCRCH